MKQILTAIMITAAIAAQAQTADSLRTYIDTNIRTNNVRSITGAMMNNILNDMVNHFDSAMTVTSTSGDTLFVYYWDGTTDTLLTAAGIEPGAQELNDLSDVTLTSPDGFDILVRDDESNQWINRPMIDFYNDLQDSISKAPPVTATWIRDTTNGFLYQADTSDLVGINTAVPAHPLDVKGSFRSGYMHVWDFDGDVFYIDPVGPMGGAPTLASLVDTNYFSGYVEIDSTLSADVIEIPATTSTVGQIKQGGSTLLHTYHEKGDNNLFIGQGAGNFTADSSFNIGIGAGSLPALTTGYNNIGIGYNALNDLTIARENIAIGYLALSTHVARTGNVAIGYEAMRYASSNGVAGAAYNTAVGAYALRGGTTPSSNSGVYNTAYGYNALYSLTSGNYNVSMGATAGNNMTSGSSNVLIGYSSGDAITTTSNNTAIGYKTLDRATGSNNTIMGYQAADSLTTGSGNVIIGNEAGGKLTTESNKLYIENSNSASPLIYGDFANDTVRINGVLQATGNIVGTIATLPATALEWSDTTASGGVGIATFDDIRDTAAAIRGDFPTDTKLTQEEVEDFVGAMVASNTETLITVTYEDGDGTLDFVVNNDLSQYSNATSGFLTALPASALEWSDTTASSGVGIATYDDVRAKLANVVEDTSPQLGGNLDLNGNDILFDETPGTDETTSGQLVTMENGNAGAVAFGDVCYVAADGDMEFADADAATTMPGLYMAAAGINAAASGLWLRSGIARDDTWNWTPGGFIYISTTATSGNTLTQTAPSGSGDQVQIVGVALTADIIDFNPQLVIVEVN